MKEFDRLKEIVDTLRHPEKGCPWDLKQTSKSLISGMIEEVYEVAESVDDSDYKGLKEELGDCLLHILLQARIATEEGRFSIADVLEGISDKLVRRHPHVFGQDQLTDAVAVKKRWEEIKMVEKKERESVLDGVPAAMPALLQGQRLQEKAASVGFDWDSYEPVFDKIAEEVEEVKAEITNRDKDNLEAEIGDLLFSVVNLARKLGVDSEDAMKRANKKFSSRFRKVEKQVKESGKRLNEQTLDELDKIWDNIKKTE